MKTVPIPHFTQTRRRKRHARRDGTGQGYIPCPVPSRSLATPERDSRDNVPTCPVPSRFKLCVECITGRGTYRDKRPALSRLSRSEEVRSRFSGTRDTSGHCPALSRLSRSHYLRTRGPTTCVARLSVGRIRGAMDVHRSAVDCIRAWSGRLRVPGRHNRRINE
jgi:hypothetical protein